MLVCCCQVEQLSGHLKELELNSKVRAPPYIKFHAYGVMHLVLSDNMFGVYVAAYDAQAQIKKHCLGTVSLLLAGRGRSDEGTGDSEHR